jgi:hypothetical protein
MQKITGGSEYRSFVVHLGIGCCCSIDKFEAVTPGAGISATLRRRNDVWCRLSAAPSMTALPSNDIAHGHVGSRLPLLYLSIKSW